MAIYGQCTYMVNGLALYGNVHCSYMFRSARHCSGLLPGNSQNTIHNITYTSFISPEFRRNCKFWGGGRQHICSSYRVLVGTVQFTVPHWITTVLILLPAFTHLTILLVSFVAMETVERTLKIRATTSCF